MSNGSKGMSFDKLVDRFNKAIALLKRKITMNEIALYMHISAGLLSRYRKPQLYNITPLAYDNVFESLDKLILEKFNQKWDKDQEEYDLVAEPVEAVIADDHFDPKLSGLGGKYLGFSWNRSKTEFSSKYQNDIPADYYNLFTMSISEHGDVECDLEKTRMTGWLRFIGPKKISIDLHSDSRRLMMFGEISLRDDLSFIEDITLAYVDSGDKFVKAGLCIINRADGEKLPTPKSMRADELMGISAAELKYLLSTQVIAGEWSFIL